MPMKEGHIFTDSQIERGYVKFLKGQVARLGEFDKIVHHITSPGGDVYEGYEAYHYIRGLGKPIKTIVEGQCQSIATFIALAGDEIVMLNPSRWMIHEAAMPPMSIIHGDADSLDNTSKELRKINSEMAERYATKTKQPIEAVLHMMKKETTMTAREAQQFGFVDSVVDSLGDMKQYQSLKAVALGNKIYTMENNEEVKSLFKSIEDGFANMFKKFSPVAQSPVALDLALKAGGMLNVATENGDLVEKPATLNGQPAPDGSHELADGRVVVVSGGVIKEVKEMETPEQKQIKDLQAQLTALQAEKEAALAAQTQAVTQVQQATQAVKELETQVVALKKMTVGDPNPVGKGKIQEPKTNEAKTTWQDEAKDELFKEAGLDWIKNLKQN